MHRKKEYDQRKRYKKLVYDMLHDVEDPETNRIVVKILQEQSLKYRRSQRALDKNQDGLL